MGEGLFLYFAVLLNPFSQVLVLWELMKERSWIEFAGIYWRATVLSYLVFVLFLVFGEILLTRIFQIRFESLRIFGGLIILWISIRYISEGAGSNLLVGGDVSDLAPQISLPFIVGPATIWQSILIGRRMSLLVGLTGITSILLLNFAGVIVVHLVINLLERRTQKKANKYFGILMRINALIIGAIGVEMILAGIEGTMGVHGAVP